MTTDPPFRAGCSCGWALARDKHAANLPPENNRSIAESAVNAHQFAHDFAGESHDTTALRECEETGQ